MIVTVKIVQKDLLAKTEAVLADGKAILTGKVLSFPEKEPFSGKGKLEMSDEGFRLIHQGETESITELYFGKNGQTTVRSPFGEMIFTTRLTAWNVTFGHVELEYQILQEDTPAGWFRLDAVYVSSV
ncbi:MAG: DUF1934 family protein [Solobacterium sp.]|nr:DUF1934 family protein [Solobacterium sp.]